MKLYLAREESHTLMDGSYTNLLGVFSTRERAYEIITKQRNWENYEVTKNENCWRYVFDGELVYYLQIDEIMLDKEIDVQ